MSGLPDSVSTLLSYKKDFRVRIHCLCKGVYKTIYSKHSSLMMNDIVIYENPGQKGVLAIGFIVRRIGENRFFVKKIASRRDRINRQVQLHIDSYRIKCRLEKLKFVT